MERKELTPLSPTLPPAGGGRSRTDRRWLSLVVIAVAALMIALDATIVSIALPSAQAALGATTADRQWVVTAYTLAFGGLLLLGGRVVDHWGRKRVFLAGLAGFALASMLGGAAPSFTVLVAGRALQGAFAALLAPATLSLLATSFTEPRERATAFSVYGSIAGTGAALGLLLGGVLTQYLSWRWCLYVNAPIALIAGLGGWLLLQPGEARSSAARFDLAGVVLATGGLTALVYACSRAVSDGWLSGSVLGWMAASVGLLVLFVVWQTRAAAPLLPLAIVLDRSRGGAYLAVALGVAGMFGAFLLLTYYLQAALRYTPLQAGLAFLPIAIASQAGSWGVARRLMPVLPPRLIMAPGALVAAAGMGLLSFIQAGGGYLTHVLPAEVLLGLGISCMMVPAFNVGTQGVDRRRAGIASAVITTAQQVGGSLGTALLNTIAAGATAAYLATQAAGHPGAAALVHGYSTATRWGAAILVLGAVVSALLISGRRPMTNKEDA